MKKFIIAMTYVAGAYALWRFYEYRKSKKQKEMELEEDDISSDSRGSNHDNWSTPNNVVVSNSTVNVNTSDRVSYNLYSDATHTFHSIKVPQDEAKLEFRRRKFEKNYGVDIHDVVETEGGLNADSYIEYNLCAIDKQNDTAIWTLLAAMFGYEFEPTKHQRIAEDLIIKKMRNEKELYFGERYPEFYGTAAELLLYFGKKIALETDSSQAGALEKLLNNGKFFDAILIREGSIEIDSDVLEKRVNDMFLTDISDTDYNIFGEDIQSEISQYDPSERGWNGQLTMYIANLFGIDEY